MQGGDGFFNEILNGFLSSRHKAPLPPIPSDFLDALGNNSNPLVNDPNGADSESHNNKESDPLLSSSAHNESGFSHLSVFHDNHISITINFVVVLFILYNHVCFYLQELMMVLTSKVGFYCVLTNYHDNGTLFATLYIVAEMVSLYFLHIINA